MELRISMMKGDNFNTEELLKNTIIDVFKKAGHDTKYFKNMADRHLVEGFDMVGYGITSPEGANILELARDFANRFNGLKAFVPVNGTSQPHIQDLGVSLIELNDRAIIRIEDASRIPNGSLVRPSFG